MTTEPRILSCGHPPSPHDQHTTGTAHTRDGREICWTCADNEQRDALKTRLPFVGYVSAPACDHKDPNQWTTRKGPWFITTWTGGELARVDYARPVRLTRTSYTHGRYIYHIHATDAQGVRWHGRGSPGIAIKMRPTNRKG